MKTNDIARMTEDLRRQLDELNRLETAMAALKADPDKLTITLDVTIDRRSWFDVAPLIQRLRERMPEYIAELCANQREIVMNTNARISAALAKPPESVTP